MRYEHGLHNPTVCVSSLSDEGGARPEKPSVHEIPNALPANVAEQLRGFFMVAAYQEFRQLELGVYGGRFKTGHIKLPSEAESYRASFGQSAQVVGHPALPAIYERFIKPIVESRIGIRCGPVDLLAYRLMEGDGFRFHRDDYAGRAGFVYYLSMGWKWDWGGLLLSLRGNEVVATVPEFNKLVIFDHKDAEVSPPHCVTQVAPWALEPRYMLVGLVKEAPAEAPVESLY